MFRISAATIDKAELAAERAVDPLGRDVVKKGSNLLFSEKSRFDPFFPPLPPSSLLDLNGRDGER